MNAQEKELVTRFLEQLKSARLQGKDPEADALIREACARQPDAAYLLVQRAIQLEELLNASQTELQNLKKELDRTQPLASRGFLNDANAWGRGAAPAAQAGGLKRGMAPPAAAGNAMPARGGSWGSGLFGNLAATAAGVVAGSFLFQGIQGLMNRDEGDAGSAAPLDQQAAANEPELLNSEESAPDDLAGSFFGGDDGGDFV